MGEIRLMDWQMRARERERFIENWVGGHIGREIDEHVDTRVGLSSPFRLEQIENRI